MVIDDTTAARPAPARARGWLPGLEEICYGGDYNPEQWPEEVWDEDVTLMREAGVNLVSVGIFAWARLEPREGEFDFGWLDRLLDLLHGAGIRVDLGTPTASPPAWFYATYPQARVVTSDGVRLGFGSRGMASPSSPEYRRAAARVAGELARHYADHPALVLWHVHNEYGAPVSECYSEHSQAAFRGWLRTRYGTLEALNEAWGTAFWGQQYGEWDHVGVPAATPTVANPAQRLDFARFTSDALLECYLAERDAIRAACPDVPVTTNFMAGTCLSVDLWRWAREVDVVANDHYLVAEDPDNHIGLAQAADLTRSLAGGRPWLLMEHSTSAVNWQPRNIAKRPGEMARNALTHVGRGADAVMFFQWRASRSGAEKFHSAMLPHAGTGSRVWREVRELGAVLGRAQELRGSIVPRPDVAILWDWQSFWAQDLEWRPSTDLDHRERVDAFYRRLWRDHVPTDFAHPEQDLSAYRLVLAPASYLLTDRAAENLRRYVTGGGNLLVSFFSAVVDGRDGVRPGGFGAALDDVLGLGIEEFLPLRAGETVRLAWTDTAWTDTAERPTTADVWSEHVVARGAQTVASYLDGPAAGGPAVTRHRLGAGSGWYVSTRLAVDDLAPLLRRVYDDAGVEPPELPAGLELMRRQQGDREYAVAVNHNGQDARTGLDGVDLVSGERTADAVVPAGGVRVLRLR